MINLVVVEQTLNHKLELIESSASSPLSAKQTKTKYTFVVFLNLHTRARFLSSASTGLFYFWFPAAAVDNDVVFLAEPESCETIKVGMF